MAYSSLREFVELLDRKGQLLRIRKPISQDLEITEIADRAIKAGGPALLFENVTGHGTPVLANAFGSMQRMAWALGVQDVEEIATRVRELLEMKIPEGLVQKAMLLPKLYELSSFTPKSVKTGPCQEIVQKDVDLDLLPICKCWPMDGGRFITLPLVFTRDPKTQKRNVGMYRMQIYDKKTTGMHWQIHKVGSRHFQDYQERRQRMEVAVALGGDPAMMFSALAPLPEFIDEVLFTGFLRKEPVAMVKCKTVDLEVPADADIILEGYVDPSESRIEGPFGDHTGYYSLEDPYPVFHVTCVTQRRDAIYPHTIVGRPPMEDGFMGKAVERIFLPFVQNLSPEIVDMHLPIEGIFHNVVIVSIKKRYPYHARKIAHSLWGMGQLMFSKIVVVMDGDVNIQDPGEVLWLLGNNIDPKRDIFFTEGPLDALNYASDMPNFGSKMGIDATTKWKEEGFNRPWPPKIVMDEKTKQKIDAMFPEGIGLEELGIKQ